MEWKFILGIRNGKLYEVSRFCMALKSGVGGCETSLLRTLVHKKQFTSVLGAVLYEQNLVFLYGNPPKMDMHKTIS
jgi:hypothetical protein